MAYVDENDVQISLARDLSLTEVLQVRQWVGDAEMLISRRLGPLAELDEAAVKFVVREAVINRLRNPEGFVSETVDDYTFRHSEETRRVTILDEWWSLLDPDSHQASASIRPSFESDSAQWSVRTPTGLGCEVPGAADWFYA